MGTWAIFVKYIYVIFCGVFLVIDYELMNLLEVEKIKLKFKKIMA